MLNQVIKNDFGYYELKQKPSYSELQSYYKKEYYQKTKGSYQHSYSEQEVDYIQNKICQKHLVVSELMKSMDKKEKNALFLDIGCGEGWALKLFHNFGYRVCGLDYSSYGCEKFNPDMVEQIVAGDIYKSIDNLIKSEQNFDLIWMTNVLEHVLDPAELLMSIQKLRGENTILLIVVPNDFSTWQMHLLENNHIDAPFWITSPDHISYFNFDGLKNLCAHTGWICHRMFSDYPIDLNLVNLDTNYVIDKIKGKAAHQARVEIENFLHNQSLEKTNYLYEAMANLGFGRQIIGFFT